MADDQKQSPTNFAGNSFILAALVATGTFYFVHRTSDCCDLPELIN
ncbi:MAG: hypothetical protein ACLP4V_01435 [Methylocella sp.]